MSAEAPKPRQRQKSISKGEVPAVPKRVYKSHLDRPIHAPRQPTLRWGTTLPPVNGFLNLAVVLALCGALAFIIGNINRHGIRVHPSYWFEALRVDGQISWAPLVLLVPLPFFAGGTFFIEKRIAAGVLDNFRGRICHALWLLVLCIYPVVCMLIFGPRIPFFPAFQAFMGYTALMMKLWSYAQTNRWCREKRALEKAEERDGALQNQSQGISQAPEQTPGIVYSKLEYPDNLTVKELAYFIVAPTLCYELNYPKTERRNYKAIAYRVVEFAVCMFTLFALVQQWLIPAHKRALLPYARGETMVFIEKMLITAIAQNIVWLIFFYTVFHSWCILLAEILCFADKKFYDTWWQAENLDAFWRKWNLPVHNWAVRHIYIPMLRRGYGKRFCQYAVFIFSGLFHEYVSSPPLRIMRGHFVIGFIFQVPIMIGMAHVGRRYGPVWPNLWLWTFLTGFAVLCFHYFNDHLMDNYGEEGLFVTAARI